MQTEPWRCGDRSIRKKLDRGLENQKAGEIRWVGMGDWGQELHGDFIQHPLCSQLGTGGPQDQGEIQTTLAPWGGGGNKAHRREHSQASLEVPQSRLYD